MRLVELDPRWLLWEGKRIGFMFRCPLPAKRAANEWQTCFFVAGIPTMARGPGIDEPFEPYSQYGLVRASGFDGDLGRVQPCKKDCAPTLEEATFENISVTPSLDGSAAGNWHGHITNGQIVGGI